MKKKRCQMSSCEFVTFITAIACNIANSCSADEVALLSAVFSQLGDTLETIQAKENILNNDEDDSSEDNNSKEDNSTKDSFSKDKGNSTEDTCSDEMDNSAEDSCSKDKDNTTEGPFYQ